jgi:hypothetical protein
MTPTLLRTIVPLAAATLFLTASANAQSQPPRAVPTFAVEASWPKVPPQWKLGDASSIAIDAQDNVYVLHRPRTLKPEDAAKAAPPVMVFDSAGNFVKSWGGPGPGFDWPEREHGIHIDHKGFAWIGGNNCPASGLAGLKPVADDALLKFTLDGKFVLQIGKSNQSKGDTDTANVHRAADAWVLPRTNDLFVADGYGNHRVAVIDMLSGRIKRYWGAYGNVPSDTNYGPYNPDVPLIPQFRNPVHCAEPSKDGLVYVCDRPNDRIQVFQKTGKFVKEKIIKPQTKGDGSVWDIAFSRDPAQKYIFLADGKNEKVYIMDRQSLEILSEFGDGGRQPGQWFAVHSIATDSKGNIFTTETYEGKRIQKFVYKGMATVATDQGVVWPKR